MKQLPYKKDVTNEDPFGAMKDVFKKLNSDSANGKCGTETK